MRLQAKKKVMNKKGRLVVSEKWFANRVILTKC